MDGPQLIDVGHHDPDALGLGLEAGKSQQRIEPNQAATRPMQAVDLKGEAIVGYAVAKAGAAVDPAAVCATVVEVLGPTFRPREVRLVPELPKTQSGKIVRRVMRQKYLGEEIGDLSTVANPWAI